MTVDPRTPCLIGVAQQTWRPDDVGPDGAPEPLDMWQQVCRAAAEDSRGRRVLDAVDSLQVVYCQSWPYDDPPRRLAESLGIEPRHRHYSGIGGTTPQQLVQGAARALLAGEYEVALVTGAEALATKRRLKKEGRRPEWRHREAERSPFPFEAPFHPAEVAHEVFQAWLTFPVFDIARRARLGVDPDRYRLAIGELLAPLSAVAAQNPHAWFPIERSATELAEPTADNRLVGYPYTKYEVSVMDVDMAAAVVVATHGAADRLGVPVDRRVYLRGWCDATDPVYLAEHPDLSRSPAMAAAGAEALRCAGIGIDDVGHLDLYSCFGSSVHLALDALGLSPGDERGITVTGGLPFAGGPASNYLTHALTTMVHVLRADPGSAGLVSGVGMHLTKHVYAVYSTDPGAVVPPEAGAIQSRLDQVAPCAIRDRATGPAAVASYTVAHGRDGRPAWALLVCDLPEGDRCYARSEDEAFLADLEAREWVGERVELVAGDGDVNLVAT